MSSSSLRRAVAAVGLAGLCALTACSSDASVQGVTSTTVAGDVTTTVAVPVTDAATTVAPTPTDAPTTTAAPAPGPAGWTVIDPASVGAPLAFPCCASNWFGLTPSPALPAAGAALADGAYRIDFEFPTAPGQPVKATVYRFELCSNLPANTCEDNGGFTSDDLGVDESTSAGIELSLDGALTVVLGGFTGSGGDNNFAMGNGADLTELVTALDADYQTAVLTPAAAGADYNTIVADLVATPAYGFGAPVEEFAGALSYTHGDAPPLLFQYLPGVADGDPAARGSDVIGRIALIVSGGAYTITTYAGFYS